VGVSVGLAVLAAIANACSNVLQRAANRREPAERSLSPRLVIDLVHRKEWLAGFGLVIASFLCQATALGTGELAVVQPVIMFELPLTLFAGSLFFGSRLGRREWLAVVLLTAGLAGLVGFLDPRGGTSSASPLAWVVGGCASAVVIAILVAAGRARRGNVRSGLFGAAAGVTFGLTASFMKATTGQLSQGFGHLFTSWSLYAMVVAGVLGMFLVQNALQAGWLVAAQPGISLLDPFTSVAWGVFAFGESTNGGLLAALAGLSGVAMVLGAIALSSSPALQLTMQREPPRGPRRAGAGTGQFEPVGAGEASR
jgi:drug/metabolite transporter (DMT)-like permease